MIIYIPKISHEISILARELLFQTHYPSHLKFKVIPYEEKTANSCYPRTLKTHLPIMESRTLRIVWIAIPGRLLITFLSWKDVLKNFAGEILMQSSRLLKTSATT